MDSWLRNYYQGYEKSSLALIPSFWLKFYIW